MSEKLSEEWSNLIQRMGRERRNKEMKVGYYLLVMAVLIAFGMLVVISPNYAETALDTSVGMWLLDEDKGDVARDSSEKGNDGEFKGEPKWVAGKFGKALEFDGIDDCVEIPDSDSMNIAEGPITVVCWFMPAIDDKAMITRGTSRSTAPNRNWDLFLRKGLAIWIGSAGADYLWSIEGATELKIGAWHHVAGVWDGTTAKDGAKLYVNGKEDGAADASGTELATNFTVNIGGKGQWAWGGIIDEVAIFRKALSQTEIQRIMDSGLEAASAVLPVGKLTTAWANIKTQ